MEATEHQDKAIQLVYADQDGKYLLHPDAEAFLRTVPKPISVISVAGLYRTGKSYLLNRILLNRNNGFGVGPTINPHTKGLWCWGTPLKGTTHQGEKVNILIIDSEGIGALDEDQNHDIKIFTLAILSSSVFIYNSVGSIDQNAIQNLSLVINLTKNIQLSAHSSEQDGDPDDLAQYFPSFFWVVRDFALQLISSEGEAITPKQYLERALTPEKGFSDDVEEKNRIRRLLTSFFKERQCATLVRPLVNQKKLQHLYDCSFDDLRPEFVEQALHLRKRIFSSTKPKLFKGQHLDGTMYISILNSYLTCINNGGIPNIQNAWTYMCIEKCIKLQEQCYDMFNDFVEKNIRNSLPCPSELLDSELEQYENQCFHFFEKQKIGEESKQFLVELKQKIKQKSNLLRIQNEKQSINILKSYIIKNFTLIEKKMRMNEYDNFHDFLKSINSLYIHLIEHGPDLPKKQIVYLDFLKKVITQAAELFLKQQKQQLESSKALYESKQKQLTTENQDLKKKIRNVQDSAHQKYSKLSSEKIGLERKCMAMEVNNKEKEIQHQNQLDKMQSTYKKKIHTLQMRLNQLSQSNDQLKEEKNQIESASMVEKKQREKQKALTEMKIYQLNQELKSLKVKQNNQQKCINELNYEFKTKLKEATLQAERKINRLTTQLAQSNQKYSDLSQQKEELLLNYEKIQKEAKQLQRHYKEQILIQKHKLESYKQDFQSDQLAKIKSLEEQNTSLKFEQSIIKQQKQQNQKGYKKLLEQLKTISGQYETKLAVINQKNQFLQQELNEAKESEQKSRLYYESLIHTKNQSEEEKRQKAYMEEINRLTADFNERIVAIESEKEDMKTKLKTQIMNRNIIEEKYDHQLKMLKQKNDSDSKMKISRISELEQQIEQLSNRQTQTMKQSKSQFSIKEEAMLCKIRQLQLQIQIIAEQTQSEQEQMNIRSEDSIKQLKNYYELEKQKLQQKIVLQKQKYQKKIQKLRDEYESQIEEERKTYEQQNENLREEFISEVTLLKNLVQSLQHDNDSKTRSLEVVEKRLQQEKQKIQKKELQFNSRYDNLTKVHNKQKQILQQKINETNEQKSQAEKQCIVLKHQKEELTKEFKDLSIKYDSKVQQKFKLNKNIETIHNQHRQKLADLSNEYMNDKLTYQKKLALAEQQKQFYMNKINDYQAQHQKNLQNWEEKIKNLKVEYQRQKNEIQIKKDRQYSTLESRYQKLRKQSKEQEQQSLKNLNNIERQYAIISQKYTNMASKYQDLESRNTEDSHQLLNEVNILKSNLQKLTAESTQQISRLKKELIEIQNERNQFASSYDKIKILSDNKINFLEDIKQKNKKEYQEKIRHLETTIENIQKLRNSEKNNYESIANENITKTEKKYQTMIQEQNQTWSKKQKEYENNQKTLSLQVRSLSDKLAFETQSKSDMVRILQKKVKDLEQSQRRAYQESEKYKDTKESMTSNTLSMMEKERQNMKQKLHDREQKCKKIENAKQQLFYEFEKQRAKWNLQKDNYSMKNQQLKETISKNEKDLQKLLRENEKLKAERKNSKLGGGSSFSRFNIERTGSKFKLDQSIHSINLSMSKQNCNPLGDISFFNNQ